MPELPEVETIVMGLKKKVLGRTFLDAWTDFKKTIKRPKDFKAFQKELKGKKIEEIRRRGKNIIFNLSSGYSLLIHQKLTGHLLFGKWSFKNKKWEPKTRGPLTDRANKYIHLMFFLDKGQMLALSDVRKFAKVELWKKEDLDSSIDMEELGPEPLEKDFVFNRFEKIIKRRKGKIKQVLMDQKVIAGIGNIYSDEILWRAKVSPFQSASSLKQQELHRIYSEMKDVLSKAIELEGESFSDFRTLSGEKGRFDLLRKVYQREGEKCSRCGQLIKRAKLGSRSAHFCPKCQPLKAI